MLQAIRDGTRGWIAYVIVAILVVPFALFGLYNYVGGGGAQEVASVDGEEISRQQFDQAWQQRQSELRQVLGDQFDLSQLDTTALRRDTLNELIDRQLLINFSQEYGLRVSDADVVQAIRSQPLFQVDGQFSSERYRDLLAQNRLSAEAYESQLRRDLILDLVARSLGVSTFVNERELDQLIALQWQERRIGWVEVPQTVFVDSVSVSQSQVEDYFAETADQYQQPEQVQLEYVLLDPAELEQQVDITDEQIAARYQQMQTAAQSQSARQIRHILTETEAEIKAALEALEQGDSFAQVASNLSIDRGSARNGGALGLLQQDDVEDAFANAAWGLSEGQRSKPVQTSAGWHIIEVTEIRESSLAPLDEMADEIASELAAAEADRLLFEQGNTLDTLAFENPDSLEPAASALEVSIRTTDWVSRNEDADGFASDPAVLNAAFSQPVLERRENSQLLELSDGRYAVVRVSQYREAREQTLDEVREQVESRLRNELASQAAQEAAEGIAGRIVADQPLTNAVNVDLRADAVVVEPRWVQRGASDVPSGVQSAAFRLPRVAGSTAVDTIQTENGWAVLQLSGVRDGDQDDVDEAMREQLVQSLRQIDGEIAFEAILAELRAQARIRVNEDRFN